MEPLFEKMNRLARLHMDLARKTEIRARLAQFIDAHAAVAGAARPAFAQPAAASWQDIFSRRFLVPVGSLALIILVGAGTSLAAESALPGEPLYAVKVNVSEPIAGALIISDVAKAQWQTEIAGRRLEEADKLAIAHQLNDGAKTELEANFKQSAEAAARKIAVLSEKGNTAAASNISTEFASTLKAHAEILAQLGGGEGNDSGSLASAVGATLHAVAEVSGKEEAKAVSDDSSPRAKAAANAKLAVARKSVAAAKEFVAMNIAGLGEDAHAAAEARLAKAAGSLAEAEAKFEAGDWNTAFLAANRALRAAQETRVLATAQVSAGPALATAAPMAPATGARTLMGVAAKRSLNLLEDRSDDDHSGSDRDGGDEDAFAISASDFNAGATTTASSMKIEPQGAVTSGPSDASYIMNGEGTAGSNP